MLWLTMSSIMQGVPTLLDIKVVILISSFVRPKVPLTRPPSKCPTDIWCNGNGRTGLSCKCIPLLPRPHGVVILCIRLSRLILLIDLL